MKRSRAFRIVAVLVLILVAATFASTTAMARAGDHSKLTAVEGYGKGLFVIAPTAAVPGTFSAEMTVNIHQAPPNTTFTVWRARDPQGDFDGVCANTNYLQWQDITLTTSNGGAGALHFHYEAPFPDGEQFNVRFQFRSTDGSTVLQSDCLSITVK
ncbi:MAG: hypothetical protein M3220_06905 [Chloroflexota bacterium]|nr:hypothetical protein [Chloroflexota bacterium]